MLEAVKLQNYSHALQISQTVSGNEVPDVVYHTYSRTIFTLKHNLEALKGKDVQSQEQTVTGKGGHARKNPQESSDYIRKSVWLVRGKNTRQGLEARKLRVDRTRRLPCD